MKAIEFLRNNLNVVIATLTVVIISIIGIAVFIPVQCNAVQSDKQEDLHEDLQRYDNAIDFDYNHKKIDSLRIEIIEEIDSYITSIAPNHKIDAERLFGLCDIYCVDVRLVLAQGQIESHYATAGTAKKTNSIFNVGAFDGHSASRQCKNGFCFNNPNESIEPYLILLTNSYLVNGKTEQDLMNNFVNYKGMRYASSKTYEKAIKRTYNKINRTTKLDILLQEYNELKNDPKIIQTKK